VATATVARYDVAEEEVVIIAVLHKRDTTAFYGEEAL
jgi:hypothetical protein